MWIAALGALAALACTDDPDDNERYDAGPTYVQISGSLIRDDGSAASGVTVKLLADGAELTSVATGADGAYALSVEQGRLTGATLLAVRATVAVNGKEAEIGFDFAGSGNLTLPAARFLEAAATPSAGISEVTVAIPNYADPSDRRPAGYAAEVKTISGDLLATQTASASSSIVSINKKLLEDYATSWRLKALLQATVGGVAVDGYAAGLVGPLGPQNATPLSRGKGCTYANTDNQTPAALTPCPVTDGDLATHLTATAICTPTSSELCAEAFEELVIDLGGLQTFDFFAVHKVTAGKSVLLASSESGTTFHTIATFEADNYVYEPVSPVAAHYLRLKYNDTVDPAANPSALSGLNEIVVY
jgi:hypothetical protein